MKTTTETYANNKLIAEFMGLAYCERYQYEGWYENAEFNHRICGNEGLSYHKSWDWLMPVVVKIDNTESYITTKETMKHIRLSIPEISLVYHFVVDFIKWYNKNN